MSELFTMFESSSPESAIVSSESSDWKNPVFSLLESEYSPPADLGALGSKELWLFNSAKSFLRELSSFLRPERSFTICFKRRT